MDNITLDQLKGIPEEKITNPNIRERKPIDTSQQKEVDPSKILGLKYQSEIDRENPDMAPPEEKVFGLIDEAIDKKINEVREMQELYDQTEGNITEEDMNSIIGFDPIEMMKNPPKPGRETRKTLQLSEEEKRKIMESRGDVNTTPEIKYNNDEIDHDALLEKEIMEGIPDDDVYEEFGEDINITDNVSVSTQKKSNAEFVSEPPNKSDVIAPIPEKQSYYDDRSEDDDLKELEEDIEETSTDDINEERIKMLKEDSKKKIKPVAFGNLTGFKVSKKPISITNAMQRSHLKNNRIADWVLPSTGRIISMREFKGTEIDLLMSEPGRNKLNTIRQQYQLIYDHVVDPYKPDTVDAWAKLISIADVDHLYAAIYRASFEGKNFIPYDCPDNKVCKNSFLSDSIPFMDMVKFKNSEAETRFNKLINSVPNEKYKSYETSILPISDVYALGFREPSIYDVVFVSAYLDDEFIKKYQDVIAIAPYIDGMYYINAEEMELRPVNVKEFPNDIVKSQKAKIITLSKIIKDLTSDQYNMLVLYVNETLKDTDGIEFIFPETHCPKCGRKIDEHTYSASQLLFLRHRLTVLVNG